jgi:hypothetical protein
MSTDTKDTDALREHLERYSELGERHLFRFRDGRHFEGWVVEVGEEDLLVTSAGPGASEEEIPIPFTEIDLSTLAYVDAAGARIPYAPVTASKASAPS